MSDEAPSVPSDGTAKTLARLTTTSEPTADKNDSPVSPELPTVVATKPPMVLGGGGPSGDVLSSIPESSTEPAVVAEEAISASAASTESKSDPIAEPDEEPFATPEAKLEPLPSPTDGELTSIPLSPTGAPPTEDEAASSTSPKSKARSSSSATLPPISTQSPSSDHIASPSADPASATTPVPPAPAPLEALLSPTEPEGQFSTRQSVASSDVTDDETRFSTVLLSARQSLIATPRSVASSAGGELHTVDEGTGSDENTLVAEDWRAKHKKSSSNSTILSANNVPYLLAKLEEGAEDAEAEGKAPSRPASLGGTAEQIKEEFYKRQSEEEMVDWGASRYYHCSYLYGVVTTRLCILYVDFWGKVINGAAPSICHIVCC